jgi:DNA-binding beta-propeller fold protein YncE
LFVTDGNTIRKISATAEVVTTSIAGLSSPAGMDFDDLGNLIVVDRGNSRILRIDVSGAGVVVGAVYIAAASTPRAFRAVRTDMKAGSAKNLSIVWFSVFCMNSAR